jgi:hypothetical protein
MLQFSFKTSGVKMKILCAAALVLVLSGCGGSEQSQANSGGVSNSSGMLQIKKEIGIELGDTNFVFGVIQDIDFNSSGNVAVLDMQKKTVRLFSIEGEFLGEFGGEGEGPGEFLNPSGLACLNDGRIAVTDPFSREIELFDENLLYSETISDFSARAPFIITSAAGGFAGEEGGFNRDEGILSTSLTLRLPANDSSLVLYETTVTFTPEDMASRMMLPSAGLVADSSNLYYAPPLSEAYSVKVFPLDGTEPYALSYPDYSPKEKTSEEIDADILAYETRMQAMASSGHGRRFAGTDYEPPREYYSTGAIGVDSMGNIWVQRGWEANPVFDLFSPGSTEPSETIIVDPELDLSGFTFVITPHGIAAFDPDPVDYPRVFILTVST